MSLGKAGGISIPAVILHDAEGFPVTVETKTGEMYQGLLTESLLLVGKHPHCEDNFNVHLKNVQYTDCKGRTTKLQAVFLRGSRIKMIILPQLLQEAPVFQRVERFRASRGKYVPSGI